ncbi:sulfite exporter TauE/SafE family protein [Aestuariirhabdus sp. LZHN29]|uniref:sulfite exporter TauE/SafE family protein n=1 Tax=Aestuariirhabdus sp. LZHN29 TaxID=3417462 RepID=UPI003CF801CE
MTEPSILMLILVTFLLAGTVKGVIGLGLPSVSLAILAVAIDLPSAMALLIVPTLVTNLWQGMVGGHGREIVGRLWPFLSLATLSVWLGAQALTRIDHSTLSSLLGVLLALYALINLAGVKISIASARERWLGAVLGLVNGVLMGMTGSCVVPGVIYLQAIGLSRDILIQSMGMLFSLSTLALAFALESQNLLSAELGLLSALGLPPAIAGMMLGQAIRRRLSAERFRILFFIALFVLGVYIII